MNDVKISQRWLILAPAALALACALAAAHAEAPRVQVDWTNPATFSDARQSMCRTPSKPEEWLTTLGNYVQRRAGNVIGAGQHLHVTFTDVMRAGVCEPWRGPRWDDVRIVKDIYPPSIDLRFVLTDADGNTARKGEAKLRDLGFLSRDTPNSNEPLRYEKRMLDRWLHREFRG